MHIWGASVEPRKAYHDFGNSQEIYEIRPDISGAVSSHVELLLSAIQNALDEVEKALRVLREENLRRAQQAKLLQTVPGIGEKIVLPMLVLLHRHVPTAKR